MLRINRVWAHPDKATFTIKPIAELVYRYVGDGLGWIDPFAGANSPAGLTNDLNPLMPTKYHMKAEDFVQLFPGPFDGAIIDPPYSYRQISEHYRINGLKATQLDTSYNFIARVINNLADKIRFGGWAISCGWNSNGFGKGRGFQIIEILVVAHGGHHNDTIVTVEQKVQGYLISKGVE